MAEQDLRSKQRAVKAQVAAADKARPAWAPDYPSGRPRRSRVIRSWDGATLRWRI